jgi:hypothetical protein
MLRRDFARTNTDDLLLFPFGCKKQTCMTSFFPFVCAFSVYFLFSFTDGFTKPYNPLHSFSLDFQTADQYSLQFQTIFNSMFSHTFNISLSIPAYSYCNHRMLQLMSEFLSQLSIFFVFFFHHIHVYSYSILSIINRHLLQFYVPVPAVYFPKFPAS